MKVWVVEAGVYSDRWVIGVYDSIEAAIAAHPVQMQPGWVERDTYWTNGCDWDDARTATPFEVQGA